MSDELRADMMREIARRADLEIARVAFVAPDGDDEPTLWLPRPLGGDPICLFRRCDVGEAGWALVFVMLAATRAWAQHGDQRWIAPADPNPPGVRWKCPRCGKEAVVVGNLEHVRCTCGHVSATPTPRESADSSSWCYSCGGAAHDLARPGCLARAVHPDGGRVIPSRSSDPATSKAAEPHPVKAGTQRHRLLAAFGQPAAAEGLTDEEAADLADGVPYRSEFAKRCSELRAAALVEVVEGVTRPGVAGHQRIVSRITEAGRATLATLPKPDGSA